MQSQLFPDRYDSVVKLLDEKVGEVFYDILRLPFGNIVFIYSLYLILNPNSIYETVC